MRLLSVLLAALALAPAAAGSVSGEQRLLVLHVTWGPEPWTVEDARSGVRDLEAHVRTASFGRAWITGEVTPWLRALSARPAGCDIPAIRAAGTAAAAAAGYDLARYARVGFAFPRVDCPWVGAYESPAFWMNGALHRFLLAHELGHTWGVVEEGPGWTCAGGGCRVEDYASPYSLMGHGFSDYNAYEKASFGWLDRVVRPGGDTEVVLGAIDRPTTDAHALHVLTADDEYWIEYRPPEPVWPAGWADATPGVVVHAGTNGLSFRSRYPQRNLLLLDPVGAGRPSLAAGETFAVRGAFSLTVRSADAGRATVALRWTDTTRPAPPRIESAGRTAVRWRAAAETGSGVSSYEVRVNGRLVRRLPAVQVAGTVPVLAEPVARYRRLARGRHRVTVVAVDRAGNRSRPATRIVRVGLPQK